MKLEMGESLCYSYLRHVKQCWLVQTNWKPSEHWTMHTSDAELETMFLEMKRKFDADGKVFKRTNNAAHLMKQGEIDIVGIDTNGNVYALDVAFHENGLNYTGDTGNVVLKKLLRAYMLLRAYIPSTGKFHISFVSPKVYPSVQKPLDDIFDRLRSEYTQTEWNLITNEGFANLVRDTMERSATVADTSELFVRAAKLLSLAEITPTSETNKLVPSQNQPTEDPSGQIQPSLQDLVKALMATLLEEHPTFLDAATISNLTDPNYCKSVLGLKISNLALLRRVEYGKIINGRPRYWAKEYAGKFYVCSQWGRTYHPTNAESLRRFASAIADKNPNHPGIPALRQHISALRDCANS